MSKFTSLSIDERIKRQALIPRPLKHHSLADWDFENVDWILDEVIYHTEVPSLLGIGTGGQALIKHATTGALSDGRLILWLRSSLATELCYLIFRNQKADGDADRDNTYSLSIYENTVVLKYYLGGEPSVEVETKDHTWSWVINTWYRLRLTWWTSAERLYVRIERWTGTAWVTLGGDADIDFQDVNDRWKNETVNRCGLSYYEKFHQDDLEVWG